MTLLKKTIYFNPAFWGLRFFLLLAFWVCPPLYGQVLKAEADSRFIDLQTNLYYFEETDVRFPIAALLQRPDTAEWLKLRPQDNLGMEPAVFWFRSAFEFDPAVEWLLNVDYPLYDQLDVYFVESENIVEHYQLGDAAPFPLRPIQFRNFLLDVPNVVSGSLEVYIRVQSSGSISMPLELWERNAFWEEQQVSLLIRGGFFGLLIVMIIYNLFIYFLTRDTSYFYYVGYALAIGLFQFSYQGFSYQYLWPALPQWHQSSLILFISLAEVSRCLFTISFLNLKQRLPFANKLLLGLVVVSLLFASTYSFIPYKTAIQIGSVMTVPSVMICMVVGMMLLLQGVQSARYFVSGWTVYFVGMLAFALTKNGYLNENVVTQNAMQLGIAIEMVMFSWALADRINFERREREVAQKEAIVNLERFKSIYDNAVEGMFQCKQSGLLLGANLAMAKIMGYDDSDSLLVEFNDKGAPSFLDYQNFFELRKVLEEQGRIYAFELKAYRRDGQQIWLSVSAKRISQPEKFDEYIIEGFVTEITQRKRTEEQLRFLSRHDPLTGLVNRREFESRLEVALDSVRYNQDHQVLLFLDLDQFKLVNDTCGHVAGDELLRQVTIKIRDITRGGDTVSRFNADEFGILLSNCMLEDARRVADKIRYQIQELNFSWQGRLFNVGGSIGVVELVPEIESVIELTNMADAACDAAKAEGRNRVHVFDHKDAELSAQQSQMQWAARITESLEKNFFQLYVQPISPVSGEGKGTSYEVLLRLLYDGEIVFPGMFLPAAERYNLMPKLDRWVVRNVFSWLHDHPDKAKSICDVSINLSGLTLGDREFPAFLRHELDHYNIVPEKICFEITETIAVTDLSNMLRFIEEFRSFGCSFSLDDFGSGFSSYGYLKNLPVDYLKIDGGFVKDMDTNEIDRAMVESIHRIGHVMGKKTIAEFVENDAILEQLEQIGVDYAQGYGIARPFPIDEIQ